jgi:hypothetical protein
MMGVELSWDRLRYRLGDVAIPCASGECANHGNLLIWGRLEMEGSETCAQLFTLGYTVTYVWVCVSPS